VAHVLGCRDTAVALAQRWDADETDAARAGLLHDITKALDGPLQLTLCREYGIVLDEFSGRNPKTLHALTGSLVADRVFGENRAVVDAICSHTTGKPNMNTLEKIIYVADYMEPNRHFDGVEELRRLAFEDLDQALKLGLEMTLEMLRQQGREISPESQEALTFLNNQL
jgi:nicotinate-nucleotide adenylyltransferase